LTLEISGKTFKDTKLKTMYFMECKITNIYKKKSH